MGLVQGDVKVTFTVDSREYRFDLKRCTGVDVNICRRSTGYGPIEMVGFLQSGTADIDVISALAWLARRQNGEQSLPFEAVASKFNYDIDLHVDEPDVNEDDAPEDSSPE